MTLEDVKQATAHPTFYVLRWKYDSPNIVTWNVTSINEEDQAFKRFERFLTDDAPYCSEVEFYLVELDLNTNESTITQLHPLDKEGS